MCDGKLDILNDERWVLEACFLLIHTDTRFNDTLKK